MKQIKLTPSQREELKKVTKYFLEAVEPIEDSHLRAAVSVKILSRISALSDRLTSRK